MTVSKAMQTAVASGDIVVIRDTLWCCIAMDPGFRRKFRENWNYCVKNGITAEEIYQPHDGRDVDLDATEGNFDTLCGQLSTNFSQERLDAIKRIGKSLHPASADTRTSNSGSSVSRRSTTASVPPQSFRTEYTKKHAEDDWRAEDDWNWTPVAIFVGATAIGAVAGGFIAGKVVGEILGAIVGGFVGNYIINDKD